MNENPSCMRITTTHAIFPSTRIQWDQAQFSFMGKFVIHSNSRTVPGGSMVTGLIRRTRLISHASFIPIQSREFCLKLYSKSELTSNLLTNFEKNCECMVPSLPTMCEQIHKTFEWSFQLSDWSTTLWTSSAIVSSALLFFNLSWIQIHWTKVVARRWTSGSFIFPCVHHLAP